MGWRRLLGGSALLALLAALGGLLYAAHLSRGAPGPEGPVDGRLAPCPPTPNCVTSEAGEAEPARSVDPLPVGPAGPQRAWRRLRDAVAATGGEVVRFDGGYLAATYRTPLLGFVDDLEARLDPGAGVIHLRSASRVGRSDLGANRRRVARLAEAYRDGAD